jgi:hypothetical protein
MTGVTLKEQLEINNTVQDKNTLKITSASGDNDSSHKWLPWQAYVHTYSQNK